MCELKMTEKKQGRRSAKDAEETRFQILRVAAEMFCDLGYERVSLRNISEKAGVSHSLIRHHFGSKDKIWYAVSDCLHDYIQRYINKIMAELPKDASPNVSIYLFVMRLFTTMVHSKKPIQFLSYAVKQEDSLIDYFISNVDTVEHELSSLAKAHNALSSQKPVSIYEIKWQMLMYANGAVCLTPFMERAWNADGVKTSQEGALLNHWRMFNEQMIEKFNVDCKWALNPISIEELMYDIPCIWKYE